MFQFCLTASNKSGISKFWLILWQIKPITVSNTWWQNSEKISKTLLIGNPNEIVTKKTKLVTMILILNELLNRSEQKEIVWWSILKVESSRKVWTYFYLNKYYIKTWSYSFKWSQALINANTSALREIVLVSAPLVPTELADYFLAESPKSY